MAEREPRRLLNREKSASISAQFPVSNSPSGFISSGISQMSVEGINPARRKIDFDTCDNKENLSGPGVTSCGEQPQTTALPHPPSHLGASPAILRKTQSFHNLIPYTRRSLDFGVASPATASCRSKNSPRLSRRALVRSPEVSAGDIPQEAEKNAVPPFPNPNPAEDIMTRSPTPSPREFNPTPISASPSFPGAHNPSLAARSITHPSCLSHSSSDIPTSRKELEEAQHSILPTIKGRNPACRTINPEIMDGLLRGQYIDSFDRIYVVDCRFPYEYEGGHITGALNITPDQPIEPLFNEIVCSGLRSVVIFYCEFSSKRGPAKYMDFRRVDRSRNFSTYPNLSCPEIYLLEGGYKRFFQEALSHCSPPSYTPMDDIHFRDVKCLEQQKVKPKLRSWSSEACMSITQLP